ncbi:hypothetical protein B0H63DRAFT_517099 [Podospora didyma]|uniref:Uncharacterized protein n=1 Tax=Podospora didyma TaxID=330526 RepID=A0AAE0P611_9PEZI|nr:hypothetical protein B0H63DRAFT_517099 [Podospora didyma]
MLKELVELQKAETKKAARASSDKPRTSSRAPHSAHDKKPPPSKAKSQPSGHSSGKGRGHTVPRSADKQPKPKPATVRAASSKPKKAQSSSAADREIAVAEVPRHAGGGGTGGSGVETDEPVQVAREGSGEGPSDTMESIVGGGIGDGPRILLPVAEMATPLMIPVLVMGGARSLASPAMSLLIPSSLTISVLVAGVVVTPGDPIVDGGSDDNLQDPPIGSSYGSGAEPDHPGAANGNSEEPDSFTIDVRSADDPDDPLDDDDPNKYSEDETREPPEDDDLKEDGITDPGDASVNEEPASDSEDKNGDGKEPDPESGDNKSRASGHDEPEEPKPGVGI